MRAPDTKKPGKPLRTTSGALKVPEVIPKVPEVWGSPRCLLSGSLSAASQHQLLDALAVLDPPSAKPSAKRESWREKIHQVLASREMHWSGHVEPDERRSRGRPSNTRVRDAVELARRVLELCGIELTDERKGKWHLLAQIFADTRRDLRHHLHASLAENPPR